MIRANPPFFVISPHLDDAVLSCGALLAANPSCVVCTVFTAPPRENMSTDWDRQSGFADAFEAMDARSKEDTDALHLLSAQAVHLPFCDAQYLLTPSQHELIDALHRAVSEYAPARVLVPLGLFHSDHILVSDACLALMEKTEAFEFYAYEEVPYRRMDGAVPDRMNTLKQRGYQLGPAEQLDNTALTGALQHDELKRQAIGAYASQLRAFGPQGQASLYSAEKYWRLRQN